MARRISLAVVVTTGIVVSASSSVTEPQVGRSQLAGVSVCRHDSEERGSDRTRRHQALALAKAINEAEGTTAERIRHYRPLSELRNLPPVPGGFDLRLYTDGAGYVVSLKDKLDPCKYGIFSDESAFIYERTPQSAPIVAGENRSHP